MCECVRLAGAGTGDDKERSTRFAVEAVSGCGSLLGIKTLQQRVNASGWSVYDDRAESSVQGGIHGLRSADAELALVGHLSYDTGNLYSINRRRHSPLAGA